MKKNSFSKKIEYLFKRLGLEEDAFTKLFWNEKKTTLYARKKSVIGKWLEEDIKKPKGFYFDTYPISKLQNNNRPFFTKSSFLDDSFDEFKKRVDEYVDYIAQPKIDFDYRYIYSFNRYFNAVTYKKITILEKISQDRYKIELSNSHVYKDREFEPYYGEIEIIKDYYYISIKNSFETVTFYFMLSKGYKTNDSIYGVSLGLSFNKGFPVSRKMLLTKRLLTTQEENEFYLHANESTVIVADESSEHTYSTKEENYLKNINRRINNLAIFTQKANSILDRDIDKVKHLKFNSKGLDKINNSINRFLEKKQLELDDILQKLIGKWYCYCYGTIADESGKFKIWTMNTEIDRNKKVKAFIDETCILEGELNTTYNKYKSYIKLNHIFSSELALITFYNKEVYKKIFKVTIFSNKYGQEYDAISIGFLSREELKLDIVRETLGDAKEALFTSNGNIEKRINELYKKIEYN